MMGQTVINDRRGTAMAGRTGAAAIRVKPGSTDPGELGHSKFGEVLQSVSGRGKELDPIFAQASQTYGVPQSLLRAIAFHESGFESDAVSSAGAMGIMQLMPATAQTMGVNQPFDAKENIFGGAKLLGQLFEKYDGDLKLTLAAYGAGSGAVAKYDGIPPYQETRGFVRDILSAVDESTLDCRGDTSERAGNPSISSQIRQFDDFTQEDYQALLMYFQTTGGVGSLLDLGREDQEKSPDYRWIRL